MRWSVGKRLLLGRVVTVTPSGVRRRSPFTTPKMVLHCCPKSNSGPLLRVRMFVSGRPRSQAITEAGRTDAV